MKIDEATGLRVYSADDVPWMSEDRLERLNQSVIRHGGLDEDGLPLVSERYAQLRDDPMVEWTCLSPKSMVFDSTLNIQ